MTDLVIGTMTIDRLPETTHCFVDVAWLFPSLTRPELERNKDWLGPDLIVPEKMKLGFSFQSFVIRTGQHTILVDTCNGNHKNRPTAAWQHDLRSSAFLDNLAGLGLGVEDIDYVLCTHLHCDHVGWNTRLVDGRWVPTFPNAQYIIGREEFDHYNALHEAGPELPVTRGSFIDSVLPVVEAGLAVFVAEDHVVHQQLTDQVFLSPSPGHSFGHVCIHAKAPDGEAIVSGDLIHHPIQLDMPELVMRADFDPPQAARTRRRVMEYCAETGAYLLAGHIPAPTISRLCRHGSSFRFAVD